MDTILLALVAVLTCAAAFGGYLYLHASFKLLDLVQKDAPLWNALNQPRKEWMECVGDGCGDFRIRPAKPWLGWVLKGTPGGVQPAMMTRWRQARLLLLSSLACGAIAVAAALVVLARLLMGM